LLAEHYGWLAAVNNRKYRHGPTPLALPVLTAKQVTRFFLTLPAFLTSLNGIDF
jgi:hypothetical protein